MGLFQVASNTGVRSPGELLMTWSTSAVAVCCSNASRVSVKSRAFSIAMTACAAKFSIALLDHFVGASQDRWRHAKAERLRGL
jgi:hypothetical protein